MYACLAETHHQYSWQNDWGVLCATAVIQRWNLICCSCWGSNPELSDHASGALTLSYILALDMYTKPTEDMNSLQQSELLLDAVAAVVYDAGHEEQDVCPVFS